VIYGDFSKYVKHYDHDVRKQDMFCTHSVQGRGEMHEYEQNSSGEPVGQRLVRVSEC
jgi:hypothetical protein